MMIAGRPLPKDVTDKWPDVLTEIKINEVPLKYLQLVLINFKDGKVWEISINAQTRSKGWHAFNKSMTELVHSYDEKIHTVEFELNTSKLKQDVEVLTKKFLKKYKL
jgi:isocitrate dehydrogenase kinase/phosphatase